MDEQPGTSRKGFLCLLEESDDSSVTVQGNGSSVISENEAANVARGNKLSISQEDTVSIISHDKGPLIINQEDNRPELVSPVNNIDNQTLHHNLPFDTYFSDERIRIPETDDVSVVMFVLYENLILL